MKSFSFQFFYKPFFSKLQDSLKLPNSITFIPQKCPTYINYAANKRVFKSVETVSRDFINFVDAAIMSHRSLSRE